MQLHVVAAGARAGLPPHYSTLPRLGTNTAPVNASTGTGPSTQAAPPPPQGKPPAYSQYPSDGKPGVVKFTERGAPEGAASVQPSDATQLLSPTGQGHGPPGMPTSMASSSSATTTAGTTAGAVSSGVSGAQSGGVVAVGSQSGGSMPNASQQPSQGAVFYAMNV